jgi:predicted benzoate:H+ symporter BenE
MNNTNNNNNNNKRKLHEVAGYRKGMNRLALVCGICAVLALLFGGLLFPLLAIVTGAIALTKQPDKHDRYWAISGISIGIVSLVLFL